MKKSLTPIAAAVGIVLASTAAHAQLAPIPTVNGQPDGYSNTAPGATFPGPDTLVFGIWDQTGSTHDNEIVNLNNYTFSQFLTPTNGNLGPSSATGPFSVATNPDGSGSVLQINFGVIPNWTAFQAISNTADYAVWAGNNTNNYNGIGLEYSWNAATKPTLTATGAGGGEQSVTATVAALPAGINFDTTGTADWSIYDNTMGQGTLSEGAANQTGTTLGSAANFYYQTGPRGNQKTPVAEGNSSGSGFWYLDKTTGDLTWNVPASVSAVPLPAAAWLLASGLAGLGAVARRRRAGNAAIA